MDHSHYLPELQNRYFALRHGQSTANVAGIIISQPCHGLHGYDLTEQGKQQVITQFASLDTLPLRPLNLVVYSSDFARTQSTAKIASEALGVNDINYATALRERNFGDWEKQDNSAYEIVWQADIHNADHHEHNVESANQVLARTISLIHQLEKRHTASDILLVSHGDTLQILQTAFLGKSAGHHRSLKPLETAELRELTLLR